MTKAKILVTGLDGYIGSRFAELTKDKIRLLAFPHRGKASVTNRRSVLDLVAKTPAPVVLHLAALTHLDRCEKDKNMGNNSPAWQVNVRGTENIAFACRKYHKHLIYLSTECVFDGKKGNYRENDHPNPVSWYGRTKFEAEKIIQNTSPDFCILRSVLAYGHKKPHPYDIFRIFRRKLISGEQTPAVSDQKLSFTFIDDLVSAIIIVIENKARGVWHFAGPEDLSPYQMALEIASFFRIKNKPRPVSLDRFFGSGSEIRLKNATLSSLKFSREFAYQAASLSGALTRIKSYNL